jgi:hypothetical protein
MGGLDEVLPERDELLLLEVAVVPGPGFQPDNVPEKEKL